MSLESLTQQERHQLALGQLTRKLVDNPETASTVKRLLMKGDPNLRFPEIELDDRLNTFQQSEIEKRQELETELKRLKAEQKQAALHKKVTDAGLEVAAVIGLLEKHGMTSTDENYDLAIDVLGQRADMLAESTPDFAPPTGSSAEDTAAMWKDPVAWRQQTAAKVLTELGVGRRRRIA